jgi:CPA2 family monovalent cation:H+ antiporter-2
MHEARTLLLDLAVVFCVATLATIIFQRLRQPVVLGYLLAGLIVGPYVPIPLFADHSRIHNLSELGVILVMFSLGLEFSLSRLVRLLPTAGLAGMVQITAMIWLGYLVGRLFGWGWPGSLFVGGMVCISSTMIVARVFSSLKVEERLSESVFSVLIVQDLAAILLITMFTAIGGGAGLPAAEFARTALELLLFLAVVIVGGMLIVPRLLREAHHKGVTEILLIAAVGICFGLALLAHHLGYSVALGAFIAGMLSGESGLRHRIQHVIEPLRDVFAAVFFVSIGMLVDPAALIDNWAIILVLTAAVVIGMSVFLAVGTFLAGKGINLAIRTGMSLAQIGEFSFIIVSVGVTSGVVSSGLYAVAVGVAVVTTFLTPMLVRVSERVALGVERRLPHPVQTFAALYGSWLESLGARREPRKRSRMQRLWTLLALDASFLLAVVLTTAVGRGWFAARLQEYLDLGGTAALLVVIAVAAVLAAPFGLGVIRISGRLGVELALRALPGRREGDNLVVTPRRAFVVAVQLGLIFLVAFPLVALTQPFLPLYYGAIFLAVLVVALGITFWKSTINLTGHVEAVAEIVLHALRRQRHADQSGEEPRRDIATLLPGMGPLATVSIDPGSPALGKTLAELNLRGLTGATVIAIQRPDGDVVTPTGKEVLQQGDMLSVTGTMESVTAARALLTAAAQDDGALAGDRASG